MITQSILYLKLHLDRRLNSTFKRSMANGFGQGLEGGAYQVVDLFLTVGRRASSGLRTKHPKLEKVSYYARHIHITGWQKGQQNLR